MGEDGSLSERTVCVYARKLSLRKIRERHLSVMDQAGLLRHTDVNNLTLDQLTEHLKALKGMF